MNRRAFVQLLGGAAAAWPSAARAQQKRVPVIGFLNAGSPGLSTAFVAAFHQALNEAGYVEGQNLATEYRWAEAHDDRLPALAADLVGRNVDVIAATGGSAAAVVAKSATSTIPIVFIYGGDPVADGVVASLARPGGNVTGITILVLELNIKRLELLADLVPNANVIALLVDPRAPATAGVVQDMQRAAQTRGVQLQILKASNEADIDTAFATLVQMRIAALVVAAQPFFNSRRDQLVALAARHVIPSIYLARDFTAAGGLISYGPSIAAAYRQLGIYAGKILKGARPADLPVQQPTTFELVINLKTAKALGLMVPQSIFARADEVTE